MNWIKSNKSTVIIISVILVVLAIFGVIATKTSIFNEDSRMFNKIEKEVVEEGNKEKSKEEMTGIVEPASEIEDFYKEPRGREVYNFDEDGVFETFEGLVNAIWIKHDLIPDNNDTSKMRDFKERARITSYDDYKKAIGNLDENKVGNMIDLGMIETTPKRSEILYKSNNVIDFGDISIVGAEGDSHLSGITLDIKNNTNDLLDLRDVLKDLEVKFEVDGMSGDWVNLGKAEFTDSSNFDLEEPEVIDAFIGQGLFRQITFSERGKMLLNALTVDTGIASEEEMFNQIGNSLGWWNEDNSEEQKDIQQKMAETINIKIKYKGQEESYTVVKDFNELPYKEFE